MKTGKNHGGKKNVAHDRISSLPDEILTHILSFLSTKEAVHMCVLSKRWRMMWATVPVLDFNLCEFFMDDQNDAPGDYGRNSVVRFERFVDGVLDNQKSTNLDIVRYSCRSQRCKSLVYMGWLARVVLLMPRVIHIKFSRVFIFELNDPISCESLQHLVMDFCDTGRGTYNSINPVSIYLPSLKVLGLTGVYLIKDFAQKLFMGCPSLEELYLCSCYLMFSSISSIKLKKLSIDACDQFEEMRISCPDLVSLLINSCHPETVIGISLKDMTSLVNATVKLHGARYSGDGDSMRVLNLFGGLSNVTNLEVELNFRKLKGQMEKDIFNCRNFNNLKKLCIGLWNLSSDIYLMACILKHSPNLKDLTLAIFVNPGDTQLELSQEVLGDVSFQHEYLDTIKIKCGNNSEWPNMLIKTVDKYVKKIGNIIITS